MLEDSPAEDVEIYGQQAAQKPLRSPQLKSGFVKGKPGVEAKTPVAKPAAGKPAPQAKPSAQKPVPAKPAVQVEPASLSGTSEEEEEPVAPARPAAKAPQPQKTSAKSAAGVKAQHAAPAAKPVAVRPEPSSEDVDSAEEQPQPVKKAKTTTLAAPAKPAPQAAKQPPKPAVPAKAPAPQPTKAPAPAPQPAKAPVARPAQPVKAPTPAPAARPVSAAPKPKIVAKEQQVIETESEPAEEEEEEAVEEEQSEEEEEEVEPEEEEEQPEEEEAPAPKPARAAAKPAPASSPAPRRPGQDFEVHVGNISFECGEEQISLHFGSCPDFASLKMINGPDGRSKGRAFVKFNSERGQQAALQLNNSLMQGRKIFVELPRAPGDRSAGPLRNNFSASAAPEGPSVIVRNLPFKMDEDGLQQAFQGCGAINSVRIIRNEDGSNRGFGFVDFNDVTAARKAVSKSGEKFAGREINVQFQMPRGDRPAFGGDRPQGRGGDRGGFRPQRGGGGGFGGAGAQRKGYKEDSQMEVVEFD